MRIYIVASGVKDRQGFSVEVRMVGKSMTHPIVFESKMAAFVEARKVLELPQQEIVLWEKAERQFKPR